MGRIGRLVVGAAIAVALLAVPGLQLLVREAWKDRCAAAGGSAILAPPPDNRQVARGSGAALRCVGADGVEIELPR